MFFPFFLSFPLCFWDFYYTNIDISTLILIALCFTFHLFIPMPYRILKPDLPTCSFSLQLHPICYSTHLLNSLFPRMPTYSCFMDPFPSFAWYSLCLLHPHRRLGTWIMFPLPQAVNLPFSFHSDYTSQLLITAPCELFTKWDHTPPLTAISPRNSLWSSGRIHGLTWPMGPTNLIPQTLLPSLLAWATKNSCQSSTKPASTSELPALLVPQPHIILIKQSAGFWLPHLLCDHVQMAPPWVLPIILFKSNPSQSLTLSNFLPWFFPTVLKNHWTCGLFWSIYCSLR